MALKYRRSGDAEYVSYGRSVRYGNKVRTEYTYIGKVVNKNDGLFYNRKLGYVVFDHSSKRILPAPRSILPEGAAEDELAILDFGDAFLLYHYLHKSRVAEIIDSLDLEDRDTVYALIMQYAITTQGMNEMRSWYEGNYASQLYPDARLDVHEIIGSLEVLGQEKHLRTFSDAYFEHMTDKPPEDFGTDDDDPHIIISVDGQSVSPDMEMPLTSKYDGMSNKDKNLRLVIVFSKDDHIPLYFRYVPDRLLRSTGITAINERMNTMGVGVNFSLMDNDYCTRNTVYNMCKNDIPFVTMMPVHSRFYPVLMEGITPEAMMSCPSYVHNGDRYYVSETRGRVRDDVFCMLYIVMLPESLVPEGGNRFNVIVSSKRIDPQEATTICYVRSISDRYFMKTRKCMNDQDSKEKMSPASIRGHMIVSFIASTLVTMIRGDMDRLGLDPRSTFNLIKNQKCKVFRSRVIPAIPSEDTAAVYSALGMTCPTVIPRRHGRT